MIKRKIFTFQTVTLTATPINTNADNQSVGWNYFAGGTAGDNNPIIHQMTKDADNFWYSYKTGSGGNRPIRPDDIYPEIFFVPSSHAYTNSPEELRINRNNFPIFQFSNPFTIRNNTGFFIEFNTWPQRLSGPPSVDLVVYLIDNRVTSETFFSGDWRSSDYTALVGTVNRYDEYSHTHS